MPPLPGQANRDLRAVSIRRKGSLAVAVQAGGASRRMGQNKALMPFLGRPLIARVIDRLDPIAGEVMVITNQPDAYAFLGVRLVSDLLPGAGPLGGLFSALQSTFLPLVASVACDMPFVSPQLLIAELNLLVESGADAVVPRSSHGLEPLHAIYRRDTCLPAIDTTLKAGQYRFTSFLESVNLVEFEESKLLQYDPHLLIFLNLNTPVDFHRAERIAETEGLAPGESHV
jgi:molybdopterin-guanine dinucleotide biosynthesis protein A